MDISDVLNGNFLNGGWESLENAKQGIADLTHDAQLRQYQSACEIAKPFMTPEGKLCLQTLKNMTILQPTWVPDSSAVVTGAGGKVSISMPGLFDGIAKGFAREGQNSLIRHIENCIVIAQNGPPTKEETTHGKKETGTNQGGIEVS